MIKPEADISIVVPVYNESGNIRPLAKEVSDALTNRICYELIFVDDRSTDDTLAEIEQLKTRSPLVSVRTHETRRGQSAAVRTGVTAARTKIVVAMDGDGQNDPRDILNLYDRLKSARSLSMVIGDRRCRKDSWLRRISSRVANAIRSRVLGDGVTDSGCGLRIFYRDEYLDLPAFDHMHRFLPALMQMNGGQVSSVPVNHRPRIHGASKYGIHNRLWVGLADMLGVRWLQKRRL